MSHRLKRSTAEYWLDRAYRARSEGRIEDALHFFSRVPAAIEASEIQVAHAMKCRGLLLAQLGRVSESLRIYDDLVERFGESPLPRIQEQVAMALLEKGDTLCRLNRAGEGLPLFEEVIRRFEACEAPELRREVARARNLKYLMRRKGSNDGLS